MMRPAIKDLHSASLSLSRILPPTFYRNITIILQIPTPKNHLLEQIPSSSVKVKRDPLNNNNIALISGYAIRARRGPEQKPNLPYTSDFQTPIDQPTYLTHSFNSTVVPKISIATSRQRRRALRSAKRGRDKKGEINK